MIFRGRHFLIIAGHPWEDIDGIRCYVNLLQPCAFGEHMAQAARAQGATATLLMPDYHCHSVAGLVAQAKHLASRENFDAVLLLASWSSIRTRATSDTKLKLKTTEAPLALEIEGNLDFAAELAKALPHLPQLGFDHTGDIYRHGDQIFLEQLARMIELADMFDEPATPAKAQNSMLAGRRILITGGPTAEPLNGRGDMLSNFSSGAQGAAIATAFADAGGEVLLVQGPSRLAPPAHENIEIIPVWTAQEMVSACEAALPADVFIGVAAVADFAPVSPNIDLCPGETAMLTLRQNPDILAAIGHLPQARRPRLVIGFAAENDPLRWLDYARNKCAAKNCDALCANLIDSDFLAHPDHNSITFVEGYGAAQSWGRMTKQQIAKRLVKIGAQRLN